MKIERFVREMGEFKENDMVCHCFQFAKGQIEKDYVEHGHSTNLEKI